MAEPASFVLVANRLPVRWDADTGSWEASPGGLVSALTPILRERSGVWVGWTGLPDFAPDDFEHAGIEQSTVRLSVDELETYYLGFCNGTLWPLYHNAIRSPEFHRHWWRPYHTVNRRFAARTAERLTPTGVAWVQDYQLQLVPGELRRLRPEATIGFFLHIPFPPIELFAYLPWRTAILEGLLGADVLAFQTRQSLGNFRDSALRYANAEADGDGLRFHGRSIRLEWAPIAIDSQKFARLAASPEVGRLADSLRANLGADKRVILGVDRLDYTKGIDIRLRAIQAFFECCPTEARRCVFLQIAVPSREEVLQYARMREQVERLVGHINGDFGAPGYTPVTYMYRNLPVDELVACYRTADLMLVTPLADGMNLVAKEYVASRLDDDGALVLSEFAGAANELDQAVLVNPTDIDGLAATLQVTLRMPDAEKRARMASLRAQVRDNTIFDWSRRCMETLEEVGAAAT